MCYRNKRFLFEARPDLFPEGLLTDTEIELWTMFEKELEKSRDASSSFKHR